MKNEIFAFYGYKFKLNLFFEYFSKRGWYKPHSSNADSVFFKSNEIEKHNVKFIHNLERKLKIIKLLFIILIIISCDKRKVVSIANSDQIELVEIPPVEPIELTDIDRYLIFLSDLDDDIYTSTKKALSYLDTVKAKDKNNLFLEFLNFFKSVRNKQTDYINKNVVDLYQINSSTEDSLNKELYEYGYVIAQVEEYKYIGERSGYISRLIEKYTNSETRRYLEYREIERDVPLSESEGYPNISWKEIFKRLRNWEKFNIDYPEFYLKKDVESNINSYIKWIIEDYKMYYQENGYEKLKEEVQVEYESYLSVNTDTESYKKIKRYYHKLKDNEFVINYDIE